MNIAIIANGNINNYIIHTEKIRKSDFIIACDGGLNHLYTMNVMPNLIVGDMDSVSPHVIEAYKSIKTIKYPGEKNETDLELALQQALLYYPSSITVYAAIGGRFDHALGNIHCIAAVSDVVFTEIWDEHTSIYCVTQAHTVHQEDYQFVSLIPLTSHVKNITTDGLKYPLKNECLYIEQTRGISNEFVSASATINLELGTLIIIRSKIR